MRSRNGHRGAISMVPCERVTAITPHGHPPSGFSEPYLPCMFRDLTAADISAAADRLAGICARTPLRRSGPLTGIAGADVWLKLECAQVTGSFKLRGAYNTVATMPLELRERGIVTASAGNHGLGCAWAARALGMAAVVCVPSTAPDVKKRGIRALGATVDDSSRDYDAAHELALKQATLTGAVFVSPTNGNALYAGQGTVAKEILDERSDIETIVVPVGGGGLTGGVGRYAKETKPSIRVIGVQTDTTDAMARSVAARRIVEIEVPPTLADGLAGQIDEHGLEVGLAVIDDIAIVTEAELGDTIAWLWRTEGIKVEGAGAVGVAAIRFGRIAKPAGPIAVIVTGGNIDDDTHAELLRRFPG